MRLESPGKLVHRRRRSVPEPLQRTAARQSTTGQPCFRSYSMPGAIGDATWDVWPWAPRQEIEEHLGSAARNTQSSVPAGLPRFRNEGLKAVQDQEVRGTTRSQMAGVRRKEWLHAYDAATYD